MTKRGPRALARRVAVAVALGGLALGALTACRSEAGTAAFVGSTRIRDSAVNAAARAIPAAANIPLASARTDAVEFLTFNELASRYARDKGYGTPPKPTADTLSGIGTQLQVNDPTAAANNKFVQAVAQTDAWENLLLSKATAVTPSDADLQELYNVALNAGVIPQGTSFDSTKSTLAGLPNLGQALGLRKELEAAAKTYDVSVSPRYAATCTTAPCARVQIPLLYIPLQDGSSLPAVYLPLGGGDATPAVLDTPASGS